MPGFVELMEAINEAWTQPAHRAAGPGRPAHRRSGTRRPPRRDDQELHGEDILGAATESLLASFDATWGGFGHAPKFPQTFALGHLLRHHLAPAPQRLGPAVTTSLDAMASGGMLDQIGGGFSRYSVDDRWLVPHFEKMLYDNALLIRIYAEAGSRGSGRW